MMFRLVVLSLIALSPAAWAGDSHCLSREVEHRLSTKAEDNVRTPGLSEKIDEVLRLVDRLIGSTPPNTGGTADFDLRIFKNKFDLKWISESDRAQLLQVVLSHPRWNLFRAKYPKEAELVEHLHSLDRAKTGSKVHSVQADDHGIEGVYDNGTHFSFMRTDRDFEWLQEGVYRPENLNLASLKGKKILDAGTGDGKFVEYLRRNQIDARGLDIHLNAKQRALPYFIQRSMDSTGLPNSSFDVIFSSFSIFYYRVPPDVQIAALKELNRILKDGGEMRLVGPEHGRDFFPILSEVPDLKLINEFRTPGRGEDGHVFILRKTVR